MTFQTAHQQLHSFADPQKARFLMRFFKTGKGQYGEGDRFLGIVVPQVRLLVKEFAELDSRSLKKLIHSPFNEERLLGLLILERQYLNGDTAKRARIYDFYISNIDQVNNWNLVDSSAPSIFGFHLLTHDRSILYQLTKSKKLWRRRVAIVSTFAFIRAGEFEDTLNICSLLLGDSEDLIHKACGWMLREVGKKDFKTLENYLSQNYRSMPRTMLRYAIERFPEKKRLAFLKGTV